VDPERLRWGTGGLARASGAGIAWWGRVPPRPCAPVQAWAAVERVPTIGSWNLMHTKALMRSRLGMVGLGSGRWPKRREFGLLCKNLWLRDLLLI
jgi:hypothetical protein